jgi:hypothetical protein
LWSIAYPQPPWDFRHGKKESGVTGNDNIKQNSSISVGNFHGKVAIRNFIGRVASIMTVNHALLYSVAAMRL